MDDRHIRVTVKVSESTGPVAGHIHRLVIHSEARVILTQSGFAIQVPVLFLVTPSERACATGVTPAGVLVPPARPVRGAGQSQDARGEQPQNGETNDHSEEDEVHPTVLRFHDNGPHLCRAVCK